MIALGGVALPRGAQVFRTSTCSPDIAEFVLSIAALTGQAYAFYLPFIRRPEEAMSGGEGKGGEDDDTEGVGAGVWKDQLPSQEEMLAWMAEFPREYDDSMARRRMMGRVGVAALRRYHRACALVRAEGALSFACSPAARRASFSFLARSLALPDFTHTSRRAEALATKLGLAVLASGKFRVRLMRLNSRGTAL